MKNNCVVKNCKGEYGGWIDCNWGEKGEIMGRLPFCKKHFEKVYHHIKEHEKEMQEKEGKDIFLAFAPLKEVEKALNS